MAGDDSQQLEDVSEVGLVTAALAFQSQQEVPPTPDSAALVFVDHVHKQEGEHAYVPMGELRAHNIKHVVQRVQSK